VEGSTLKETGLIVSLSINVLKRKFGSFLDRPCISALEKSMTYDDVKGFVACV
jgi:hypothetical protein